MADQIDTATGRTPRRERSRATLPLIAGSLIAAAGLVFGGITTASAHNGPGGPGGGHGHGGGHPAPTSTQPAKHGDSIPNVTTVENEIKAYYGTVAGSVNLSGGPTNVSLPDPKGNYAKELAGIEAKAEKYFSHEIKQYQHGNHGAKQPALVFDVDDTTLNTYDYEIYSSFAYNPTTNADFVNNAAFPEVFGMPSFVNWAASKGYTVFFLTGRPSTQRTGTVTNLTKVGYSVPTDAAHLYLKPTATDPLPSYLPCATISACTTIQYKSATRAHIASLGYKIVGDFGDQFSDLKGGTAGHQVKLPNPMYYLP
jgi:HAD superfamily, subfamily IIIB (Acid phosphatase)